MTIEFVNHACYILESGGIHLMTDPWLEGPAFHNGWALIEPTAFPYERFKEVTHIWFSHEHPDHFSPPNLKKIPEADRKRITILFQKTKDRKVVDYCRSIGFEKIVELPSTWTILAPGFRLLNLPHTDGDSWLCVEAGDCLVLNVNDCNLETDAEVAFIAKLAGRPPDVLFTQFSYANSIGNRDDTGLRAQFAKAKLDEIHRQIRVLRPRFVVPFASFVWFSHEENFFRNDAINTIDVAYDAIAVSGATPVVLFNGDRWQVEAAAPSQQAIKRWKESYKTGISAEKALTAREVSTEELQATAHSFLEKLRKKNSPLIQWWLEESTMYVRDHKCAYRLSMKGFEACSTPEQSCDVSIGSEALHYCFKFEWGGSTTRINGRYEVPPGGNFRRWKKFFLVSQLNNQGQSFGLGLLLRLASEKLKLKR